MTDPSTSHPVRTVLFVDVCGSTELYETLGDDRAARTIMGCLNALRRECEQASGRVIQRIGDELMCLFDTADAALLAAFEMQEWMARNATSESVRLAVRIGCHAGPVLETADEIFGDAVNVAARVAAMATARQILTTAETTEKLSPAWHARMRPLGRFTVRGKRDELSIHELPWQADDPVTELGTLPSFAPSGSRLVLRYAGREIRLDARERIALTLGREPSCSIVVSEPRASRHHARIETRQGKFVLIDQSANGTYVRIAPDEEVVLRHEELILYRHGAINLGQRDAQGALAFSCE